MSGQMKVSGGHIAAGQSGRYGTVASTIHANVCQDEWLTFENLQHLPEATDARLANSTNQPQGKHLTARIPPGKRIPN
jgi:hypothetical protein